MIARHGFYFASLDKHSWIKYSLFGETYIQHYITSKCIFSACFELIIVRYYLSVICVSLKNSVYKFKENHLCVLHIRVVNSSMYMHTLLLN